MAGGFLIFRSMLRFGLEDRDVVGDVLRADPVRDLIVGSGNLGGPTVEERDARIATEPTGDFYYGRRYFVEKTRFWGYLRQPRQPWNRAKLVIMREDKKTHAGPDVGKRTSRAALWF